MTQQSAYTDLIQHFREFRLLESIGAIVGWDQHTYMPPHGAAHRAEQMGLLAKLGHSMLTAAKIGDLLDELHGANAKGYAVVWVGDQPNADEIAKRVSPTNYVTADVPPIITIHGDKDALVPYEQSVELHKKLDAAKIPNELYTVPGANHGGFTFDQNQKAWAEVRKFLQEHVKGLGGEKK